MIRSAKDYLCIDGLEANAIFRGGKGLYQAEIMFPGDQQFVSETIQTRFDYLVESSQLIVTLSKNGKYFRGACFSGDKLPRDPSEFKLDFVYSDNGRSIDLRRYHGKILHSTYTLCAERDLSLEEFISLYDPSNIEIDANGESDNDECDDVQGDLEEETVDSKNAPLVAKVADIQQTYAELSQEANNTIVRLLKEDKGVSIIDTLRSKRINSLFTSNLEKKVRHALILGSYSAFIYDPQEEQVDILFSNTEAKLVACRQMLDLSGEKGTKFDQLQRKYNARINSLANGCKEIIRRNALRNYGDHNYDDMFSCGLKAVPAAARSFDLSGKTSFSYWLHSKMRGKVDFFLRQEYDDGLTRKQKETLAKIEKQTDVLRTKNDAEPSLEDVAEGVGLTVDDFYDLQAAKLRSSPKSLSGLFGNNDGGQREFGRLLEQRDGYGNRVGQSDEIIFLKERKLIYQEALSQLKDRDRYIIEQLVMGRSGQQIANDLGITKQSVRKRKLKIVEKLREHMDIFI